MAQGATARSESRVREIPLMPAPGTPAIDSDLWIVFGFLFAVVSAVWAVNGGWHQVAQVSTGLSHLWRPAASYSGIATSLCAMVGLLLASRMAWMERAAGLNRILTWHRIAGDSMGILLAAHIVTAVMAEMPLRGGFTNTVKDMTGRESYMLMTTIGAGIVGLVVISSLKSVRSQLSYETWYLVHLTAYAGIVMSYSHQIYLGSLLSGDRLIRFLWGVLSVYVLLLVVVGRWSGILSAIRHPLRVVDVRRETDDTVAVVLGGRNIERYAGEAGQFVMMRILKPGRWWTANPYSLSSAPTTAGMRITVKDRGDSSAAAFQLRRGDRVAIEGPYGIVTPEIFDGAQPVLIAGGVGVTPVRAMLERLPKKSRPLVLLRARRTEDIPHYREIVDLAESLGGDVRLVLGRTTQLKSRDPFAPKVLGSVLPKGRECVAFVCGPTSLTFAARKGLIESGVPRSNVHLEIPWW